MKKLGKNQREVKLSMDSYSILEGPVNELQSRVENFITSKHMECNDPELVQMGWDGEEWEVRGWRHATQKEMEKSRAASARKAERSERKQHERTIEQLRAELAELREVVRDLDEDTFSTNEEYVLGWQDAIHYAKRQLIEEKE